MMKQIANRIFISCLTLAALAGFVFVACKSDSGKVQSFDEDSPHVMAVSPADSTTDVSVNTSITVSFDESMYPSTISFNSDDEECSGGVQLSRDGFISCVPLSSASLSYDSDKKVFTLSPQSPLDGKVNYKIKITTDAKDLSLNPLETDFLTSSGFTTKTSGPVPVNSAQAIYFGDQNTKESELTGTIKIDRAIDESDIAGYNIYWGSSETERLADTPLIGSLLVSADKLQYNLDNTAIPGGATHFLAYSSNENGDSLTPVALDIPDTVLKMVADINGSGPSNPHSYKGWNSKLYFSANDGSTGAELWEFDGVSAPKLAADITGDPASSMTVPQKMVEFNSKLYFTACDSTVGCELRGYDGTSVSLVEDIYAGTFSSDPTELTAFGGKLYFSACDVANGCELWFWDGTPSPSGLNIGMVADIAYLPTPDSSSDVKDITELNGKLYFSASDGPSDFFGREIWWYDGTTPPASVSLGTNYNGINIRTTTASSDPEGITVYGERLIFGADDGIGAGKEPWISDGTISPTTVGNYSILSNITGDGSSSSPKGFTEFNGKLYFSATTAANGDELWVYDGNNSPTLVADINPSGSSSPSHLFAFNGMLIFSAFTTENGNELYGYNDYDPSGTPFMIADINNGSGPSMPEFFTVFNSRLYFTANDGTNGNELWVFYTE